jgi:hypothetical protein
MANINQTARVANPFGTPFGGGRGNNGLDYALKPGYILKARNNFYVVEAREALSVDLVFSDTFTVTAASGVLTTSAVAGNDTLPLKQYGAASVAAVLSPAATLTSGTYTAPLLSPNFDSGYIKFDDLEPTFGHLYQLCPTLPTQPKFLDFADGEWLVVDDEGGTGNDFVLPSNGGVPVGFNLTGGAGLSPVPIGQVSAKLYIKHPVGSPINVLDQAPEGDSGSAAVGSLLGVSGFLDGSMSPIEDPNWNYSLFIEHGENNLPAFRMVVDCEEYLMDSRVRLVGWKYSIAELSMSQLQDLQSKGKVTYAIINPQGIPTSSSLSGPFMK